MMATNINRVFLNALFLVLIAARTLLAQGPGTGAIVGTVTDPDGAALSNIKAAVVNEGTLASRAALTSNEGTFRVSLLPPGTYTVTIEANGFQRKIVKSVRVIP